ncbi:MAG: SUMF1/EgtB/PvdO family nonheme iron enzyme [Spirochaetes bacterium]|nr:SUMF1/EgtB/PvdO family nonheme iron enzyme [Spirochaetota bacterium]
MICVQGGKFGIGYYRLKSAKTESFYIGKYQVTQKQWTDIMGSNPSHFRGDDLPVENVSWYDVKKFIKKLSEKTGKNYRLPNEIEWEYAAGGGNKSKGYEYSGSNNPTLVAWFDANSKDKTHPVGKKKPNELGIYDMSGNVWEWCSDSNKKNKDCINLRGGSFVIDDNCCLISHDDWCEPNKKYQDVGFRLAHDYNR